MQRATTIARWIVGITGPIQVVLGVLFWSNHAFTLIPLHMAIGVTFVLALWTLALLAAFARVRAALVFLGTLWGALVIALGVTQGRLVPGPAHWTVELLHLLVGIAAMVIAGILAKAVRKQRGAGVISIGAVRHSSSDTTQTTYLD